MQKVTQEKREGDVYIAKENGKEAYWMSCQYEAEKGRIMCSTTSPFDI